MMIPSGMMSKSQMMNDTQPSSETPSHKEEIVEKDEIKERDLSREEVMDSYLEKLKCIIDSAEETDEIKKLKECYHDLDKRISIVESLIEHMK